MFQTEPILFLQSFARDWLTEFMNLFSVLGFPPFFIGITMLILFGINFRKGFLLLQMLLWAGMAQDVVRYVFGLPRPFYVDSNVQLFETMLAQRMPSFEGFSGMGAKGFLGWLDQSVINTFRAQIDLRYGGFPSGHVASTAAVWGGMATLFNSRIIRWIAPCMVLVMAISRMYLGAHFLADVVGGALVGGIAVVLVYSLSVKYSWDGGLNAAQNAAVSRIVVFAAMIGVPLFLNFASFSHMDQAASLVGINIAFLLVMAQGFPDDSGTFLKRTARFLLALVIYFTAQYTAALAIEPFGLRSDMAWGALVMSGFPAFMCVWGTVTLCVKLGLYSQEYPKKIEQDCKITPAI